MTINFPITEDAIHYAYLNTLNPWIGFLNDKGDYTPSHLTLRELDVVSEIMKFNEQFSTVELNFRAKYLHSSDVKKLIREKLEMDYANFNNTLTRISQKVLCFDNKPVYNNGLLHPILNKIDKNGIQFRFQKLHKSQQVLTESSRPNEIISQEV